MNHSEIVYPCSCKDTSRGDSGLSEVKGFCTETLNTTQSGNNPDKWPVYKEVSAPPRRARGGHRASLPQVPWQPACQAGAPRG